MHVSHLDQMTKGWFIGNFEPSLHKTNAVEVAVKTYAAGSYEAMHFHKVATEFTVIVSGEVEMRGQRYGAGSIIVIPPQEATDFRALTDVVTTVVKVPGANNDKYEGEPTGA
jgi:quercetin dioxygenase-like cupin family protein